MTVTPLPVSGADGATVLATEWKEQLNTGTHASGSATVKAGGLLVEMVVASGDGGYHAGAVESVPQFTGGEVRGVATIEAAVNKVVVNGYGGGYDARYSLGGVNGYVLELDSASNAKLHRLQSESQTTLDSATLTSQPLATGKAWAWAIRPADAQGVVRAWLWPAGTTRPEVPTLEGTDASGSPYSAGELRVALQTFGGGSTNRVLWSGMEHDDLAAVEPPPDPEPEPTGANLLSNPGFENGTTGWSAGSNTLTQVASPAAVGAGAGRVEVVTAGNVNVYQGSLSQFRPGQQVRVRGRVRAEQATVRNAVLQTDFGSTTSYLSTASAGTKPTVQGAYVELSGTIVVPATAVQAGYYLQVQGAAVGEVYHVDDLEFTPLGSLPDVTATGPVDVIWPDPIEVVAVAQNAETVTWSVVSAPAGSAATFEDANVANARLQPDVVDPEGTPYVLRVTAANANGTDSADVTVRVLGQWWTRTAGGQAPMAWTERTL